MSIVYEESEFKRYLSLLDVPESEPSMEMLRRLVEVHLGRVPFENISKLCYRKTMGPHASMDLTQYLNGIEQFHFGGTCYANAFHLNELLKYLSFDVALCGADMSKPDVHLVNVVELEGRKYLVDVGYAAPFLEPIPLDLRHDYVVSSGTDRYVLAPKDETGRSRMTLHRNGSPHHGYLINPRARNIDEFTDVIADSFKPEATFMNAILLARFDRDCSHMLHNMTYLELRGTSAEKKELNTRDQLVGLIEEKFGIPEAISRAALDNLDLSKDPWS